MTASQLRARERRMPEHVAVGHWGCGTWALLAPLVGTRTMTKAEPNKGPKTERNGFASGINIRFALVSLFLIGLLLPTDPAFGENARDWITGLPREPIHVQAWPGATEVPVCFVLYVEVCGFGHGPNFRPDTTQRDRDVLDESFHRSAVHSRLPRGAT